ncbi:MAG: hypothetical protein C0502_04210, partial [Opitutus sp.]|nr:hypothetical protein [Opitutus sp.]
MSTPMSTRHLLTAAAALILAGSAVAQSAQPEQPSTAPAAPAVQVAGSEPSQGSATRDKDTL